MYKAIEKKKLAAWEYSHKYETDEAFVYEITILKKSSQHTTLIGAEAKMNELIEQCNKGEFEPKSNYPKDYQHFSQFSDFIDRSVEEELQALIEDKPNFELNPKDFINEDEVLSLTNDQYFSRRMIVASLSHNDFATFSYYGIPVLLVFNRIFYYLENFHNSGETRATDLRPHYPNHKAFYCFIQNPKDKKWSLVQKKEDIDFSLIDDLAEKDWENVFKPKLFYDIFATPIIHKKKWKEIGPDELNQIISFGSILRVTRRSGVYLHAAVYLGWDLVIHVSIDKTNPSEIFSFDSFENFVGDDTEVEELRFVALKYNRDELYARAVKMNKDILVYKVLTNNCEHLATELVTGIKHSPQLENPIKMIAATLFGSSFKTSIKQ